MEKKNGPLYLSAYLCDDKAAFALVSVYNGHTRHSPKGMGKMPAGNRKWSTEHLVNVELHCVSGLQFHMITTEQCNGLQEVQEPDISLMSTCYKMAKFAWAFLPLLVRERRYCPAVLTNATHFWQGCSKDNKCGSCLCRDIYTFHSFPQTGSRNRWGLFAFSCSK